MSIKLIAVDIDGTLLNSQRQVTPEVFQAIQDAKAAGVKVVIAEWARSYSWQYFHFLRNLILTKMATMSSPLTEGSFKRLLLVMN